MLNNYDRIVYGDVVTKTMAEIAVESKQCRPFVECKRGVFCLGFETLKDLDKGVQSLTASEMIPEGCENLYWAMEITPESIWRALKLLERLPTVNLSTISMCGGLSLDVEYSEELRAAFYSVLITNFVGADEFLRFRDSLLKETPPEGKLAEIRLAFEGIGIC